MRWVATDQVVMQQDWRTYDAAAPRGSGYVLDQGQRYLLIKRWWFRGHLIWSREIDREEIPSFVWIARACLGSCEWVSKFQPILDAQFAKRKSVRLDPPGSN